MIKFLPSTRQRKVDSGPTEFQRALEELDTLNQSGQFAVSDLSDWRSAQEEELIIVNREGEANGIADRVLEKVRELPELLESDATIAKAAMKAGVTIEQALAVASLVTTKLLGYEVALWQLELSANHRPASDRHEWFAMDEALVVYHVLDFVLDVFFEESRLVLSGLVSSANSRTFELPLAPSPKYQATNDFRESVGLGSRRVVFEDGEAGIERLELGDITTLYKLVPCMGSFQLNLPVDPTKSRQFLLAVLYLSRFWIPMAANSRMWQGLRLDASTRLRIWVEVWGEFCQLWQGLPAASQMGYRHQADVLERENYPTMLPPSEENGASWHDLELRRMGRLWNVLGRWRIRGDRVNPAHVYELRCLDAPSTRADGTAISRVVNCSLVGFLDYLEQGLSFSDENIAAMAAEIPLCYMHGMTAKISVDGWEAEVRKHVDTFMRYFKRGCELLNASSSMSHAMIRKLQGARTGEQWQEEIDGSMQRKSPEWSGQKRSQVMMLLISALRKASEEQSHQLRDISDWPNDFDRAVELASKFDKVIREDPNFSFIVA